MNSPEITPEFMQRLAALLGGEAIARPHAENDKRPVIRLDAPKVLLSVNHAWHARPKWHASITDWDGRHIHGSPSANFTSSRPVEEIAADLRRRVLDPARAHIIKHAETAAAVATRQQLVRHRLDQLEAILGPQKPNYHNTFAALPGLRIAHQCHLEDSSGPWPCFEAEIRLHSFEAMKMIAHIIAEDHRLHAATRTA
jgi:hypothetical protein